MKILLKTFSFLLIAGVMAGCSKINNENGGGSNWKPNLGDYDPVPLSDFADDFYKWCLNKFDTNRDGILQYVEIKNVENLRIHYNGATNVLRSLEGIKYFTSLKSLNDDMGITMEALDLSYNEFLESFSGGVRLKYLNIGEKNNLKILRIDGPLTSLDVTKCPKLAQLSLSDVSFATLDLSKNVDLNNLNIDKASFLKTLDLSKNVNLSSLFIRNASSLKTLDLSKNVNLSSLFIRNASSLKTLDLSKNVNLIELDCSYCQLAILNLNKNVNLKRLVCGGTGPATLDLSKNVNLTELHCSFSPLTTLDLSKNVNLTRLYCNGSQLTTLDLSKNAGLTLVNARDMPNLTSVDLSNNKFQFQSRSFDFYGCSNLEVIYVWKGWTEQYHWIYPDNVQIIEK